MKYFSFCIMLITLLLLPNTIYSQNWQLKLLDIDTTLFPQIKTYFSLYKEKAQFIEGLKQTDVEMFEGRKKMSITNFSEAQNPRKLSVVILLDVSGSMQGQKIISAKEAAENFFSLLSPTDEATLVTFGSEYNIVTGFTNDYHFLKQSLNKITLSSRTRLYDGLLEAAKLFSPFSKKRNAIILITDGRDEGSLSTLDESLTEILRKNVEVYSLGVGNNADLMTLGRVAEKSNSGFYGVMQTDELRTVLSNIYSLLTTNYFVQYITPDSIVDVSYSKRDLSLSVKYNGITKNVQSEFLVPKHIHPENVFIKYSPIIGIILGVILIVSIIFFFTKRGRSVNKIRFETTGVSADVNKTPVFVTETNVIRDTPTAFEDDFEERIRSDIREQKTVIINKGKFKTEESLGYLVLRSKKFGMYVYEIKQKELLVGRGAQADIFLDDEGISRFHTKIRIVDKIFYVDDMGSSNGTYVNGEVVYHAELKDGDIIGLGEHELIFKCI